MSFNFDAVRYLQASEMLTFSSFWRSAFHSFIHPGYLYGPLQETYSQSSYGQREMS